MRKSRSKIAAVEALRVELGKRGWTQNELARRLETNSGTLSRWLSGRVLPPLHVALWIEKELGVAANLWAQAA
jgi:transcriptional regulator with XRE-family HTH domain